MNNLFSEIFGCYYQVITEIVNNSPLSTEEIRNIININGYTETCFHLLPKLETLPFIEKRNGKYYSLLENKIKMPITNIEKSWLKAISKDSRFGLFVNDFDESILGNIEPLYEQDLFRYYDKYSDGDDFKDYNYKKHFHKINDAMENKTLVKIVYQSPKQNKISIGDYLPLRFEFSPKDDKFRFFAARIIKGKILDYVCLNMGRILDVKKSKETFKGKANLEAYIKKFDSEEPVIVEIYDERNAIERFMVEFSTYRKNSEFDDNTQTCTTRIYYRKTDEIEILIKLLSFGPTLKVLAPERFLKLFKYRIKKQYEMIKK